jgi:hypothetical protein
MIPQEPLRFGPIVGHQPRVALGEPLGRVLRVNAPAVEVEQLRRRRFSPRHYGAFCRIVDLFTALLTPARLAFASPESEFS